MKRLGLKVIAMVLVSYAATAPAFANTNFLYPVSGSAFAPFATPSNNLLFLQNSVLFNVSNNDIFVEAALGHTAGGSYSFTVNVFGNSAAGGSVSNFPCTLFATRDGVPTNGIQSLAFNTTGQAVAGFVVPFTISANLPSGSWAHTIRCQLPHVVGNAAAIVSVVPNQ